MRPTRSDTLTALGLTSKLNMFLIKAKPVDGLNFPHV
jgi:hypothetical protein